MTVKQFFKSSAFKCILVLFSILILCGALLTIAYGFLAVSAGERLQRAVGNIYRGETVIVYGNSDVVIDEKNNDPKSLVADAVTCGDSEILSAYKIKFEGKSDVHYLVQSKGQGGYSGGTVTCWVAVNVDESAKAIKNIAKVQVGESAGQTFMNKITGEMMTAFTKADFSNETPYFDVGTKDAPSDYVSTGASLSSTAICNSVNGAVKFVKEEIFKVVEVNPYESLDFIKYINTTKTKAAMDGEDLKYDIYTKGYDEAMPFNVEIVVGADGKIKTYSIKTNGSTEDEHGDSYKDKMASSILDGSMFTGKGVDFFTGIYGAEMNYASVTVSGDTVTTGASGGNASLSTYLCMYAGAFATKNYQAALAIANGGAANE